MDYLAFLLELDGAEKNRISAQKVPPKPPKPPKGAKTSVAAGVLDELGQPPKPPVSPQNPPHGDPFAPATAPPFRRVNEFCFVPVKIEAAPGTPNPQVARCRVMLDALDGATPNAPAKIAAASKRLKPIFQKMNHSDRHELALALACLDCGIDHGALLASHGIEENAAAECEAAL